MTDLHIPEYVRTELAKRITEYVECYETHDARVWAESASEAAADLVRLADGYAAYAISFYLKQMADDRDKAVKVLASVEGTEADVELINEFTGELRKHAAWVLMGLPKETTE